MPDTRPATSRRRRLSRPQALKAKAARPKATVKPQPVLTVTVTTTAPPPAATQPAAPPADSILAKFYGTGSGNTGTFTVPSDGNWHLSWAYTNGTLFAGQAANFIVYEYGTDGTLDQGLVNALAVGTRPAHRRAGLLRPAGRQPGILPGHHG